MSSRNLRKLCGGNKIPTPLPNSDDDDDDIDANPCSFFNILREDENLDSSHDSQACTSENEIESTEPDENSIPPGLSRKKLGDMQKKSEPGTSYNTESQDESSNQQKSKGAIPKTTVHNKKRAKKKRRQMNRSPHMFSDSDSQSLEILNENESDTQQKEPQSGESTSHLLDEPGTDVFMQKHADELLSVDRKRLNPEEELDRRFGFTDDKRRCANVRRKVCQKSTVVPIDKDTAPQIAGLNMELDRNEEGLLYYKYIYCSLYRELHNKFLRDMKDPRNQVSLIQYVLENRYDMKVQIEPFLMAIDFSFKCEEIDMAVKMLEETIKCMELAWPPNFSILNRRNRLEYAIVENRPFHIAVLKYLYILSNMGCHLTALQLVKLLLNLDPRDPVAVVCIMDVIALRAREYSWLIKTVDLLDIQRKVKYMFNIRYSYALAHYQLAKKPQGDHKKADELIMDAIAYFPMLVNMIYKSTNTVPDERISQNNFFKQYSVIQSKTMTTLMRLYTRLTKSIWNEPLVKKWFTKNVLNFIKMYDEDPAFKAKVEYAVKERMVLFQEVPKEIYRHLAIITPISILILGEDDIKVPCRYPWDPFPPHIADRYMDLPRLPTYGATMLMQMFLQSLSVEPIENRQQNE